MGAMPGFAEKSVAFQRLDEYTKVLPTKYTQDLKKRLAAESDWQKAAKVLAEALLLSSTEERHLVAWLKNPAGWPVPNGQLLGELVHKELVRALGNISDPHGTDKGLPLDAYWVCYPNMVTEVKVSVSRRAGGCALGFDVQTP